MLLGSSPWFSVLVLRPLALEPWALGIGPRWLVLALVLWSLILVLRHWLWAFGLRPLVLMHWCLVLCAWSLVLGSWFLVLVLWSLCLGPWPFPLDSVLGLWSLIFGPCVLVLLLLAFGLRCLVLGACPLVLDHWLLVVRLVLLWL